MAPAAPSSAALAEIEQIVGTQNFSADAAALAAYAVDGVQPAAVARPAAQREIAEILKRCAADSLAVIPCGARTALHIGAPPASYNLALDLARMNRVIAFDPADMTLAVEAGVPLAAIEQLLAAKDQFLPLKPPRAEAATVGGTLAANLSGPTRHAYGTARDLVLGLEFVTGEGVAAKSGARVVKNVAGLDVHKLLIGSLGTLAVITSVNLRTFPQQPARETFLISCPSREAALRLRAAISASPFTLEALDFLSPGAARSLDPSEKYFPADKWVATVSAAGVESVVARIRRELDTLARDSRSEEFQSIPGAQGAALWRSVRDFPAQPVAGSAMFRCSLLPSEFAALLTAAERTAQQHQLSAAVLLRAAGVAYIALRPAASPDPAAERLAAAAAEIFRAAAQAGGRATIEACGPELKRRVDVWGAPAQDHALLRRMKTVFDPAGVLAPGRFVGGI
jgi:glycolate oxidase FAD binding subunit